jgi:hypothetical protein
MMNAQKSEATQQPRAGRLPEVRPAYLEALTLVERLHRRLLDVIKDEFDRRAAATSIPCKLAIRNSLQANCAPAAITSARTSPTMLRSSSKLAFCIMPDRESTAVRCESA